MSDDEATTRDAARYRYLRDTWMLDRQRYRLEWYLPHIYGYTMPIAEQLDQAIDQAIKEKSR